MPASWRLPLTGRGRRGSLEPLKQCEGPSGCGAVLSGAKVSEQVGLVLTRSFEPLGGNNCEALAMRQEMIEMAHAHAAAEGNNDLETTLATLEDDPVYELQPARRLSVSGSSPLDGGRPRPPSSKNP